MNSLPKSKLDGNISIEVFAGEYIIDDAEPQAKIHAIIELGQAIPADIPETMNSPEPIVPPNPKPTSSKRPSDLYNFFLLFFYLPFAQPPKLRFRFCATGISS